VSEDLIDAGPVLEAHDRERGEPGEREGEAAVEGARGRAQLGSARRSWPVGARTFFVVTGLLAAGLATALLMKARATRREAEARARESPAASERVERRVPPLKLAVVPPAPTSIPAGPLMGAPPAADAPGTSTQNPEAELLQRRLARGFGAGEGDGASRSPSASSAAAPATDVAERPVRRPSALEEKLEPTELRAVSAGVLPDRDRLITQGALLDCALETKIVSTVAGMTACHLTRDVYGTSGRVVLLDRGSRVVGRYQGGLQQGEARIFVVWTRVETPSGVVVNLDSPGTGPLGESGVGGHVDTHFWDRFGAAILLSIIEGGVDAAAARAGGATSTTTVNVANTANAGKDVIARSMEPTINIPPTLVKNQGERVGIFVARAGRLE
jgi:type IV secretion system protein VirB10